MERVVSQNISHQKIGAFRGVDAIDFDGRVERVEKSQANEERLEMLWQYNVEKSRGFVTKSIAWNQVGGFFVGFHWIFYLRFFSGKNPRNSGIWNIGS